MLHIWTNELKELNEHCLDLLVVLVKLMGAVLGFHQLKREPSLSDGERLGALE